MQTAVEALRNVLGDAGIGIWLLDVPSGKITRNDVLLRLIRSTPEVLGVGLEDWIDRVHPADRDEVLGKRRQLLAGELDAYGVEYRVRRNGGGWASLRGRVSTVEHDSDHKPLLVCGLLMDISRERETERRLHAVFDRPFQFIGLLSPDGILLETNRASVRDSGHELDEVLGKLFWEGPFFSHSAALQRKVREGIAQAARGELVRFEIKHPDKEGAEQTVDFTLTPLRDDDGQIVNVIPEGRVITELARTREALSAAEQRLNTATQAADIGLWEWDATSGGMWSTPQWWSMIGYGPDELPPTLATFHSLLHPDDHHRVRETLEARGESAGFELEFRMRCRDGSWRWIHSKGRVLHRAANGTALRSTGVHTDVTERKEAEQRLAAAERLESIGQLAAGVAHEINTPVQYVNDSVYFIREAVQELLEHVDVLHKAAPDMTPSAQIVELQQELPEALNRVAEGLARVAEIVVSMKEFSHPDHSNMVPVDLNRAIQNTLVVARNEFKYVAELETEFGPLPSVTCFGSQVNQVVLNLLVNAAHAIGEKVAGSAQKGVIVVKTGTEGDEAVISVSDDGGGIPDAIRHRIFEPFFTTKEVGRGTGQGLSIARKVIVQGHGGSLTFQTETGRGTTFTIRLPIEGRREPLAEQVA